MMKVKGACDRTRLRLTAGSVAASNHNSLNEIVQKGTSVVVITCTGECLVCFRFAYLPCTKITT